MKLTEIIFNFMNKLKSLFLITLILGAVFMSSCTSQKSFKSDSITIELKGNPSTGYTWEAVLASENIVEISKDVKYLGGEGMVGAPSMFNFTVSSVSAGSTILTLEYKRPWEEKAPLEKKVYNITVDKKGKITMEENQNIKLTYKSVSMAEGLKMMAESSDFTLLDVRRPDEFASGHIPGAVLFTNELMTKEDAEKLLPNKNQRIYVYCRSGRRSKEASQKLVDYGYSNVIEIGGILDYKGDIER
ncbi:MAG: protease inhibitor I42 family protein [Spirochaetaceae bacterium]|nr:protease inhibitor I42 family protein [Spirochaetaceae bacterium]